MSFCDEHGTTGCSDCATEILEAENKKLQARFNSLEALFCQMFECVDRCNGYEGAKRLFRAYENILKEEI